MAVEACGKRVVCVFQGAVDAFCASTAPAASTAQTRGHDEVSELGRRVESANGGLRDERLPKTCASTRWTVRNLQWEVALRAPVQG